MVRLVLMVVGVVVVVVEWLVNLVDVSGDLWLVSGLWCYGDVWWLWC